MAEQLNTFPQTNYRKYSWETWSEPGTVWQLQRGEDFAIPAADMARRAYTYAENHGLRCRTSQLGEEALVLQFFSTQNANDLPAGSQPADRPNAERQQPTTRDQSGDNYYDNRRLTNIKKPVSGWP